MSDRPDWDDLRHMVRHGMSVPSGLAGRMMDEIERLQKLHDVAVADRVRMHEEIERLRAALSDAEQEILDLKQKHCPYPHRGDWCVCGWGRPTDTSSGGTTR